VSLIYWIFGSLLALYGIALGVLSGGFRRIRKDSDMVLPSRVSGVLPNVSIVVAARNEAENLPGLISCLSLLEYPTEKFEIIVVDDRSDDATWTILTETQHHYSNFKAFRITDRLPEYAPKKRALDTGIRAATGDIILLTDADCLPPPTWVGGMIQYYRDSIQVVPGYSPYVFRASTPALVRGLLSLENYANAAVAAASTGWGQPLTPTGTNLSYRRAAYLAAGGFEPIKTWVSGDDDLFMRHLAERKVGGFSYALDRGAHVPTFAPSSWRQFWNQRVRYGSKGRHHGPLVTLGVLAVFLLNVSLVAGAFAVLAGEASLLGPTVALWLLKALMEFSFLASCAPRFGETALLKYFPLAAILYPLYVSVFGFLGLFAKFRWKE